jgi:hypothetical protein
MTSEVVAAIIGGVAGLLTSSLTLFFERKKWSAEADKLTAEAEHLRQETEAARKRPLELERKEYEGLLSVFLDPFSAFLDQNRKIYDELIPERQALEYHPRVLARFFASLPNQDRRKLYWYQRIERLRKNNREILALLQQYGGRILTKEFRDACAEFRYHADEWEDVWKAVEPTHIRVGREEDMSEGEPIPGGDVASREEVTPTLYANRFPDSLGETLKAEFAEVRRRAKGD